MKKSIIILLGIGLLLAGCSKNNSSGNTAHLQVKLTDAPGDYKAVNVDVKEVQINRTTDSTSGWESVPNLNAGVYNLMALTGGADTLLGTLDLPAGTISQVRLILGTNNTLTLKDGSTVSLSTPSAEQSGLKLNIHQTLTEGITYKLLLDFDAGRSVVSAGNSGKYNLKPVIKASFEAESGAIKGELTPEAVFPVMAVSSANDTTNTYSDTTGVFLFKGMAAGTYTVTINPGVDTLNVVTKSNVSVTKGVVTDLGSISLK